MGTNCFVNARGEKVCWDDVYAPEPAGGPTILHPEPREEPHLGPEFDAPIPGQHPPATPPVSDESGTYDPDEWRRPSRLIASPSFSVPNIFFSEILDDKRRAWLAGERPAPGSEITLPHWDSEGPPRIPGQAAPEPEAGPGPNPDVTGDSTPLAGPLPAQRLASGPWSGLVFSISSGAIDRFDHLFDLTPPSGARRAPAVPSMPDPNSPVSEAEADQVFGYPYSAVPIPPHASQQPEAAAPSTGAPVAPSAPPPSNADDEADTYPYPGLGQDADSDLGSGNTGLPSDLKPFAGWPFGESQDGDGDGNGDELGSPFVFGPPATYPASRHGSNATDRAANSTSAGALMLGVLAATNPNAAPVQTFVANPNPYFRSSAPSFFEFLGYQIPIPPVVLEIFGGTSTGASVVTRAPAFGR